MSDVQLTGHLSGARLAFVTGSGGSGKTALAATLAMMSAARGCPTVLFTTTGSRQLLHWLGAFVRGPAPVAIAGDGWSPGALRGWEPEPRAMLRQALERGTADRAALNRLGSGDLLRTLGSLHFDVFTFAVLEALGTLRVQEPEALIVVDLPATKEALPLLDAGPRLAGLSRAVHRLVYLGGEGLSGRTSRAALRTLVGSRLVSELATLLHSAPQLLEALEGRAASLTRALRASTSRAFVVAMPNDQSLREAAHTQGALERLMSVDPRLVLNASLLAETGSTDPHRVDGAEAERRLLSARPEVGARCLRLPYVQEEGPGELVHRLRAYLHASEGRSG